MGIGIAAFKVLFKKIVDAIFSIIQKSWEKSGTV